MQMALSIRNLYVAVAEKKTEEKKTRKTSKKSPAKKATAKKEEAKAEEIKAKEVKAEEKKTEETEPVIVIESVMGGKITVDEIKTRVKDAVNHPVKDLEIYVKTEENRAYFTADGVSGSIYLW